MTAYATTPDLAVIAVSLTIGALCWVADRTWRKRAGR